MGDFCEEILQISNQNENF